MARSPVRHVVQAQLIVAADHQAGCKLRLGEAAVRRGTQCVLFLQRQQEDSTRLEVRSLLCNLRLWALVHSLREHQSREHVAHLVRRVRKQRALQSRSRAPPSLAGLCARRQQGPPEGSWQPPCSRSRGVGHHARASRPALHACACNARNTRQWMCVNACSR